MPRIFVISGPAGVGKGTIVKGLMARPELNLVWAKSYTTRPPRPSDRMEHHYFFVSPDRFKELQEEGEIFESNFYNGAWYGSSKKSIQEALAASKNVVMEVEVNGGKAYRDEYPNSVLIFIKAPLEQIKRQLTGRRQNTHEEILERLATAKTELEAASWYDHVIENPPGQPGQAIEQVAAIMKHSQ
ncbi:guanylate kinase [Candidatus Berkelbacteria bacterium]|nr:guanylate kinase [Candidatus Berkelbacteria bacterium]